VVVDKLSFIVAAKFKRKKTLETGTVVYEYSERQIADRNRKKAQRLQKLRKNIKHLRAQVKRDLKSEDPETALTALAVGLIDHTYERVGNEESADEGHVGVTGWQKKHVSFSKGKATLKYVGKSGVKHTKKVTDAALVKALQDAYECVEGDNDCLFGPDEATVNASKVNAYLKTFGITAKDLRGFHANREMTERLKRIRSEGKDLPKDKKEREAFLKKEFKKALEETAKAVGHEASTLRSQYLVPNLEEDYIADGVINSKFKTAAVETYDRTGPTDCFPDPKDRPTAYPTTPWNIGRNWDGSPVAGATEDREPIPFAADFFRKHPQLRQYASIKVIDKASGGAGGHPEARQHGREIQLFPKFWKLDPKTRDFVFAHEIGHYVQSEYGGTKFLEAAQSLGIDPWDTPNLPYGQFNQDEAFADCFAAYHLERAELRSRYPQWESLVEAVMGKRVVTATYSDDTLEIVAAGMSLLLVQNYLVSNAFFDEKEIKKYLTLRRQFHGQFTEACVDLANAFEEGKFGPGVTPAITALRSIGQLSIKQEQQALRLMVKAFRGLRHLSYKDVEDPKILRLINIARRLGVDTEQYSRDYEYFLQSLVRVDVIPAPLRTLIRKVIKMPTPGKQLYEQTNPGAWFDMPEDKKQNLRAVADSTKAEQDAIWTGPYKDDPEKRMEMYRDTANRLQKIQNLAGVNLGIITKEAEEPLDKILKKEVELESDGPTEFVRLKVEDYVRSTGVYRHQRKEGDPVPREIGKLLTTLKKAKTFPTIQRVIKEAIERDLLGQSAAKDIGNILAQAGKNRAIRDGKPLTPIRFEPKTPEQFQVEHDTGPVEFDGEYTDEQKQELLGRVSRAISDLESIYGKGFCGKHAKKLAFRFGGSSGFMAKAHYFDFDDRRVWQPRVTFGEDYEGVLAHELSHYLEDLLSHRIAVQEDPERVEQLRRKGIEGAGGGIFGNTGTAFSRLGKDATSWSNKTRELIGKTVPEFIEFIDAVLASPDYKRWEDKLGSAMDTALPGAIQKLTGMSPYELPKDHPYYGLVENAKYRSDLPPELLAEALKYFKDLMGGDDRKLTYYHSSPEVWARMCEQYVYNKLIDAGISNPWLTWMSYDDDEYMDEKTFDEKLRPIMDRLFARLKGKSLLAHRVLSRFLINQV
jgi:hypothetical protein